MTVHASKNNARRDDPRIALLRELADPIRLRVIDRLGHAGPAGVSRLAEELGVPMPQLSNHLRRLREAGLVSATRRGRQVTYALSDPGLERLTPLLDSITGRIHHSAGSSPAAVASRTCYEHLAGPIGVSLYAALRRNRILTASPNGAVTLGSRAKSLLPQLGVDPTLQASGRQRFAFECLDATEHAPHLAGALADALARAFTERGWITRDASSRRYQLTATGRETLASVLSLADPEQPSS